MATDQDNITPYRGIKETFPILGGDVCLWHMLSPIFSSQYIQHYIPQAYWNIGGILWTTKILWVYMDIETKDVEEWVPSFLDIRNLELPSFFFKWPWFQQLKLPCLYPWARIWCLHFGANFLAIPSSHESSWSSWKVWKLLMSKYWVVWTLTKHSTPCHFWSASWGINLYPSKLTSASP